jgi:hypothetical protein
MSKKTDETEIARGIRKPDQAIEILSMGPRQPETSVGPRQPVPAAPAKPAPPPKKG